MLNYMSAWANCSSYHSGREYDSQIERIKGKRGPLVLLFPKIQFFLMMSICSQVSFCVLQLCSPDLLSVTTKPAPQTKSYSGLFHGVWSCRLLAGWESTASGGGFFSGWGESGGNVCPSWQAILGWVSLKLCGGGVPLNIRKGQILLLSLTLWQNSQSCL